MPAVPSDRRTRFEACAMPNAQALHGFARRLAGNSDDARDLIQETFLRAYRTFEHFTAGTDARAWLFTILYSVFISRHRKKQRTPAHVPIEDLEARFQAALAEPGDATAPTDSLLAARETSPAVEAALAALPESWRVVVLLVDVEELTYEEVAVALDCPIGTVRSRLSRARKQLFVALREHARQAGYTKAIET